MNSKVNGILLLLIYICLTVALLSENFVSPFNVQNVVRNSALFGIIGIGVAFVIITGGIDLSIGSLIGLIGCLLPMFLVKYQWSPSAAILSVLVISVLAGLLHGLLITKIPLQPFIVTLCFLMIYRGMARWITGDLPQGFGNDFSGLRLLAIGKPCTVAFLMLLAGVAGMGWFGFALWRRRRRSTFNAVGWGGLLLSLLLVTVGISRYAMGYEVVPGENELSVLGFQFKTWSITVPDRAVVLPQTLLKWCGIIAVPMLIWFQIVAAGSLRSAVNLSLAALVLFSIAAAAFAATIATEQHLQFICGVYALLFVGGCLFYAVRRRQTENPLNVALFLFLCGSGALWFSTYSEPPLGWWRLRTALYVALFLAGLSWYLQTGLKRGGQLATLPFLLAAGCGLLCLAGQTPLAQTTVPSSVLILAIIATVASLFLNQTIWGRYLFALGRNEEATRYSGIRTDRMVIMAYMICSGITGVAAILFALDFNAIQPNSHGNWYELYAIAAAVLGGCSLRGGEGTVLGVIIGATVMRVLYNSINLLGIDSRLEFAIIGTVILLGVTTDELVRRWAAKRRAQLTD